MLAERVGFGRIARMAQRLSTDQMVDFLRGISVFELLTADQLKVLARNLRVRQLKAGEIVWLQGQTVTFFTIVYSGRIRTVRRTSSGEEKLVDRLGAGRHFGLAEMITNASSAVTLIMEADSMILTMDKRALRRELLSDPEICYRLMQTMARAIFSLTRELERTSFENVHTRLARLLLQKPHDRGGDKGVSHEDLAMQLGVSRETVSRALSEFRKAGYIDTGYRKIVIRDREGLMRCVEDYDQW